MSDDLLELLSGGKERLAPARRDPVDVAIRTVYGEADPNDPESWKAVAGVIHNRAKKAGQTYDQVVTAPGQFEAWSDTKAKARMEGLDPNSDTYKAIAKEIAPVLNGEVAVPYDHFYSPGILKGRGQAAPSWDDGTGKQVGSQVFFALGDQADGGDIFGAGDTKAADAAWQKFASETQVDKSGNLIAKDTGQPLSAPQNKTYQTLVKGGLINPDAAAGTPGKPYMRRTADDTFKPGEFYIDLDGSLKQEPGVKNAGGGLSGGFGQGLADVGNSFAKIAPFAGDSALGNTLEANRLLYDASRADDYGAKAGRFTGQVVGSLPFMMAGEGALGLGANALKGAVPEVAPLLRFAGGAAGKPVVANGVRTGGNLLLRGGSLAARGAQEGAGAGFLTSGASDRPLHEQIGLGAATGAVLAPALPAVTGTATKLRSTVRSVTEPFSDAGRNRIVDRFIASRAEGGPTALDLTEYVPGSRPTLAQATGNPGIATLERGVKVTNPTPFVGLRQANDQARELAVDAVRGDKQSLDDLITHRTATTDPLRVQAFANAQPVDPSPVVQHIDAVLKSPAGQRDAVVDALTGIRSKLVKPDGTLESDPEQLWGIRQAIDDMISPMAAGSKKDGRLASRELLGLKGALDPVIEAGAPGFRDYLSAYSDASKLINTQDLLQSLKIVDSKGNITLGRVDSALTRLENMRAKAGSNDAKSIPDHIMDQLYALRSDLRREGNSELGRGSGSDTVQKLATNQLLDTFAVPAALGVGIHHPVAGAAMGLGKLAFGGKNKQLFDLLTEKLVDPTLGAPALARVNVPPPPNRLFQFFGDRVVPTGAVIAARNALLPAPEPAP